MEHLSPAQLADFVHGLAAADEREAHERHLWSCVDCQKLVLEFVRASATGGVGPSQRTAPVQVGRFVVNRTLGSGAMGLVVAAYDPSLEREVALKLLNVSSRHSSQSQLLHEARAMARLNHPNVVTVHEAGTVDDQVYIAMELVRGTTIRAWKQAAARTPKEVLAVFLQAAEGLAAAHRAGLIHRDFKPDNVLIDGDGLVRVADFGLALSEDVASPTPSGTLAYMAPEVLRGEKATRSADQFAFCVAFYEALSGRRPYEGRTTPELLASFERVPERLRPPRIGAAIARGLSVDPSRRFPTMDALIAALRPTSAVPWLVGAAAVLGSLITVGLLALPAARKEAACKAESARVSTAWNPERAASIGGLLSKHGWTTADVERLRVRLDEHAASWSETARDVCMAEGGALKVQCLENRLLEFESVLSLVDSGDSRVVASAAEVLSGPLAPAVCLSTSSAELDTRNDATSELSDLNRRLVRLSMRRLAGSSPESLAEARALVHEAKTLNAPLLRARALFERATAERHTGAADAAAATYFESVILAARNGALSLAASALNDRAFLLTVHLGQHERAGEQLDLAEAFLGQLGRLPDLESRTLSTRGLVELANGNGERAVDSMKASVAAARSFAPTSVTSANSLHNLGYVLMRQGRPQEAAEAFEESLHVLEGLQPLGSTRLAQARANLGDVFIALGDTKRAKELFEQAKPFLIPPAQGGFNLLWSRASLAREEGDFREAVSLLNEALVHQPGPADSSQWRERQLLTVAFLLDVGDLGAARKAVAAVQAQSADPQVALLLALAKARLGRQSNDARLQREGVHGLDAFESVVFPELVLAGVERLWAGSLRDCEPVRQALRTPGSKRLRAEVELACAHALTPSNPTLARQALAMVDESILPDFLRKEVARLRIALP
jgi:serine/threonine protein kinase